MRSISLCVILAWGCAASPPPAPRASAHFDEMPEPAPGIAAGGDDDVVPHDTFGLPVKRRLKVCAPDAHIACRTLNDAPGTRTCESDGGGYGDCTVEQSVPGPTGSYENMSREDAKGFIP
jgi:hypothetical protein